MHGLKKKIGTYAKSGGNLFYVSPNHKVFYLGSSRILANYKKVDQELKKAFNQ